MSAAVHECECVTVHACQQQCISESSDVFLFLGTLKG